MKTAVRYLCLLTVATICEAYTLSDKEIEELLIEKPDGCEISRTPTRATTDLTCDGFRMEMGRYTIVKNAIDPNLENRDIFSSKVKCSDNSHQSYEYLRQTNSKRNELILENCPLPEDGSFADGWPNLEMFRFENYGDIKPLTRQHFSGMNNISSLVLEINSDDHMTDDIFSDLTNLHGIHLDVKYANKNVFKNLTKLVGLTITIKSRGNADVFDTSEMKHLPAFKILQLFSSSFTRLTKRFFEGCPHLEHLTFYDMTMDQIDADAFETLTNLKVIDIDMNQTTSLPTGLFSKNKKLETIFISSPNANITSLPSGLFSNLPNLRELTVNSKLTSIPADLIRGSTNLELLNLQFNRLTAVPRDLLENHSKLRKIGLYGNEFGDTPSENLFDNKSPLTQISFDKQPEH